jgi:hypothetical protein
MTKIWMSPEFFEWDRGGLDPKLVPLVEPNVEKTYKIWRHAQDRLQEIDEDSGEEESLELGDVVKSLKEVIEDREKWIVEQFRLTKYKIPGSRKENNPTYEVLEHFGIVKPTMLQNLIKIRNQVAHERKYPPFKDKMKIAGFVENTWYFLRSTDLIFGKLFSGQVYYPPDFLNKKPFLEADFTDENFSIDEYPGCIFFNLVDYPIGSLRARKLPAHYFSTEEKTDWIELDLANFNDCNDEDSSIRNSLLVPGQEEEHKERMDGINDRRTERVRDCLKYNYVVNEVDGEIKGPLEQVDKIKQHYIDLFLYY